MDVLPLAEIDDHRFAGVRQGFHRHRLRLAQFGPVAVSRLLRLIGEVGQLHPVEGEFANAPFVAPAFDHEGKQRAVLQRPAGVGLPLIPDRSPDAVADRGGEHAGMDVARPGVASHVAFGIARLIRGRLSFCLGLLGGSLPLLHLLVVVGLGSGEGGFQLGPPCLERLEAFVSRDLLALHPGLRSAAPPGIIDQADRHTERLLQLAAEVIARSRKRPDGLWRADLPRAIEISLWFLRALDRHVDQPDRGECGRRPLQIGIPALVNAPLHVRLPGADPHLADQHIVERNGVLPLDSQRVRAAVGHHRIEEHLPLPVRSSLRGVGLRAERHGDSLSRLSLAPDPVADPLLQHHVIAEHVVERDIGPDWHWQARQQSDEKQAEMAHRAGSKGETTTGGMLRFHWKREGGPPRGL